MTIAMAIALDMSEHDKQCAMQVQVLVHGWVAARQRLAGLCSAQVTK